MDLNLLDIFLKANECGSFSKAAALLKIPKSQVSKGIKRLEQDLGIAVFRRTTRSLVLTREGEQLYEEIKEPLGKIKFKISEIKNLEEGMSGVLKISAPEDFAHTLLGDFIADFNRLYPRISFEVLVSNDFVDLTKQNLDMAFRIGILKDSSLLQKRIGSVQLILVATPDYLRKHGPVDKKGDLEKHRLLTFMKFDQSTNFDPIAEIGHKILRERLIGCNSFAMLHGMAMKGYGIALIPDFFCREQLMTGQLVRILPGESAGRRSIYILSTKAFVRSLKHQKFLDFVTERMKNPII